jgi:hypothetical protein
LKQNDIVDGNILDREGNWVFKYFDEGDNDQIHVEEFADRLCPQDTQFLWVIYKEFNPYSKFFKNEMGAFMRKHGKYNLVDIFNGNLTVSKEEFEKLIFNSNIIATNTPEYNMFIRDFKKKSDTRLIDVYRIDYIMKFLVEAEKLYDKGAYIAVGGQHRVEEQASNFHSHPMEARELNKGPSFGEDLRGTADFGNSMGAPGYHPQGQVSNHLTDRKWEGNYAQQGHTAQMGGNYAQQGQTPHMGGNYGPRMESQVGQNQSFVNPNVINNVSYGVDHNSRVNPNPQQPQVRFGDPKPVMVNSGLGDPSLMSSPFSVVKWTGAQKKLVDEICANIVKFMQEDAVSFDQVFGRYDYRHMNLISDPDFKRAIYEDLRIDLLPHDFTVFSQYYYSQQNGGINLLALRVDLTSLTEVETTTTTHDASFDPHYNMRARNTDRSVMFKRSALNSQQMMA